jgi:hypothetical protein
MNHTPVGGLIEYYNKPCIVNAYEERDGLPVMILGSCAPGATMDNPNKGWTETFEPEFYTVYI